MELQFANIKPHIMCIYQTNRELVEVQMLIEKRDGYFHERSPLESIAVSIFWEFIWIIWKMLIFWMACVYCHHNNSIENFSRILNPFTYIYTDANDVDSRGHRIMWNCVGTVSSCEGLEQDLIIFNAGLGPFNNRPVSQGDLIDIISDLYVLTIRAQCNLVIIGSIDFCLNIVIMRMSS